MPEHSFAIAGTLGNVVRCEKRNIWPDKRLHNVEQPIICHQTVHKWIVHQHVMVELLGARAGIFLE